MNTQTTTGKMTLVGTLAGYNFFIGIDEDGKEVYNIHPQEQGTIFPIAGYAKEWIAGIKKVSWPDDFILPAFLQEWTIEMFKGMKKKIATHFGSSWTWINNKLGLAYTSSSSYAAYWVCNEERGHPDHPGYKYIGFALGTNRKAYAILWDKDENEIIIPL